MVVQWAQPRTAPECGGSAAVSRRPAAAGPKVERCGMLCTRPAMRRCCGWSRTTQPRSGAGSGCAQDGETAGKKLGVRLRRRKNSANEQGGKAMASNRSAWQANSRPTSALFLPLCFLLTAALRINGAFPGLVVARGGNTYGETDVPDGLSNVTAIAAGSTHTVAVKNDGTVVAWGNNNYGQTNVPVGLSGVTAIAAGESHTVALVGVVAPPVIIAQPLSIAINVNSNAAFNVTAIGSAPLAYQWRKDAVDLIGATNTSSPSPPPTGRSPAATASASATASPM
ncbi:MAG: hypothetical protein EXS33_00825 [Pedosphaera sp.]|nr:hypothetical protein [Pedosphaera sp.]